MPQPQLPPQTHASADRPPRPEQLLTTIRTLYKAGRVSWSYHATEERMVERGFDVFDVEHVIMNGHTPEPVSAGKRPGEWSIKVVGELEDTSRKMGIVCVVANGKLLIIVTTEWEDR